MKGLALLLLALLVGSGLYRVHVSYESRRLFALLERAKAEQQQLEIEHKRLAAERQQQATHLLVEKTAREKLRMRSASPAVTHYVVDPLRAASAAASAAGARP